MQAARPRKILSPLQIGLAVQMHHHYCSRHFIYTLNKIRFCSSYNKVLILKRNACMNDEKSLTGQVAEGSTLDFIADNVDHNTCTLNGDSTMHGMGIITAITKGKFTQTDVQRKLVLHYYEEINRNFFKYENIKMSSIMNSSSEDFLWQCFWVLKTKLVRFHATYS